MYRLFSSKLGILKTLIDVSIVGDHQEVPMAQRAHVQALLADPDPRSMVVSLVHIATEVNTRTAEIYRILLSAAVAAPEAATLLDELTHQRQQGQGMVAHALARRRALRQPLGEADAGDIIHALVSPEMYRLLVIDRGWPPKKYEKWLTDTLIEHLVPQPATQ